MRSPEPLDAALAWEPSPGTDLRQQVAQLLRQTILDGVFRSGDRLPASRVLAQTLGVSRSTVTAALIELEGEGWTESRHGSGTYVTAAAAGLAEATVAGLTPSTAGGGASQATGAGSVGVSLAHPTPRPSEGRSPSAGSSGSGALPRYGDDPVEDAAGDAADDAAARVSIDLEPGRPDTRELAADAAWRRAWRRASSGDVPDTTPPPQGHLAFRSAIADHLRRSRGLVCTADEVLVTAGTSDALRLLAEALALAGNVVAVENPGYPEAWAILRRSGVDLVHVPVDRDGLDCDVLPDLPAQTRLVYVTPSHQYPTGALLPLDRRAALLSWAAERSVVIVEDDYDGEFRFGVDPVPAMASMDRGGQVVYVGTLSKLLTPSLRLGYLVASPALIAAALDVREDVSTPVSSVVQRAAADYLEGGGARRHIARQRRLYADRRRRLVERCKDLPGVKGLLGLSAGLHAVIELDPDLTAADVQRDLLSCGIRVATLDEYAAQGGEQPAALVLGYGAATSQQLDRVLDSLGDVVTRLRG